MGVVCVGLVRCVLSDVREFLCLVSVLCKIRGCL